MRVVGSLVHSAGERCKPIRNLWRGPKDSPSESAGFFICGHVPRYTTHGRASVQIAAPGFWKRHHTTWEPEDEATLGDFEVYFSDFITFRLSLPLL
jgi:hypothetical protein